MGQNVVGQKFVGQDVTGAISLGQNVVGQDCRRSVGQVVVGHKFVGQDVTGAISLVQNVVGQKVSGAGRRGAELRGAGRYSCEICKFLVNTKVFAVALKTLFMF